MPKRVASADPVVPSGEVPEVASPVSRVAVALSDAVARLTAGAQAVNRPEAHSIAAGSDGGDEPTRKQLAAVLGSVVSGLTTGAKASGRGAVLGGSFLAELLVDTATRLPLRDKATLDEQHPGMDTEQLADLLVVAATRASGAIGGAAGGLAAAQWLATPSAIAMPLELVAETLIVAAVELKLVAELHEIYDVRPPGDISERAAAYLGSWTSQRALNGEGQTDGLAFRLASAGTAALRRRITGRLARNLGSFLPFLAGAVIGARSNSAGTRRLSERLRIDLARHPQLLPSERVHLV